MRSLVLILGVLSFTAPARADDAVPTNETRYLPESFETERTHGFIVGPTVLFTDHTSQADDFWQDVLIGLSIGHRWGHVQLNGLFLVGPNFWDGPTEMRLYAALTPRVVADLSRIGLFDFELSWGAGVSVEMRYNDDYWLCHLTASELALTVWNRGSFHIELLGSLRVPFAGGLADAPTADARGITPEQSQAALDAIVGKQVGWTAGIHFGREL